METWPCGGGPSITTLWAPDQLRRDDQGKDPYTIPTIGGEAGATSPLPTLYRPLGVVGGLQHRLQPPLMVGA
jgi:hypothetical protein